MTKDQLRRELLSKLETLSSDQIDSLSFRVTHQLIKLLSARSELIEQVGGSFLPLKAEIAPVYQELLHHVPLNLAFPVHFEGSMVFGIPDGMPRGATWLEPPYALAEPTWFLVPGVGFDLRGARLGRGKGFYDRYLETRSVLKIGIAWSEQVVTNIPIEHHDVQMDFIITESFCWSVSQQKKF
jgi:5-formyltetrahydrofolate cyclo-ligase